MRALEKLQQQHRGVHAVIVGGDDVSYGKRPKDAKNWREKMLREVKLDPTRTHFLGRLPRPQYIEVLQVSAAHVYLTYPFVLSWSLLEAMACGANIVASNTAPVREVIKHGENGLLGGFFETDQLVRSMGESLSSDLAQAHRRILARQDATDFSFVGGAQRYGELLLQMRQVALDFHDRGGSYAGRSKRNGHLLIGEQS